MITMVAIITVANVTVANVMSVIGMVIIEVRGMAISGTLIGMIPDSGVAAGGGTDGMTADWDGGGSPQVSGISTPARFIPTLTPMYRR